VQQMQPFCISTMLSFTPMALVPAVFTSAASMLTWHTMTMQSSECAACAYLGHVVDDDGGVLGLRVLQQVLEQGGLARAEESAQYSDGNGLFRLLSEGFVGGCGLRLFAFCRWTALRFAFGWH
jgi:hypothetical protein